MRKPGPHAALLRPLYVALALAASLASCAAVTEPPADPATVAALETLDADTTRLLDDVAADRGAPRAPRYDTLAATAAVIGARAEARAAIAGAAQGSATAAFLNDYRDQLGLLAARDAAGPVPPEVLALRRAALADALGDALFHERDALARDR